ncbi:type 1 glutamine amidotransferase domain-containing protein [Arhodomonas sp. AD133]|uniref:type 1 glutamine amidotransferase domain-containing protein n=1 Tax=Arhodomonas sp. AD133 TaxID=3415009 RepID=UPI003EB7C916
MSAPLNVLIVLTSHASLGDTGERTGFWLEEFTTPYYVFADAGARITVASIKGGPVPIDARSLAPAGENPQSVERYLTDESLQAELQTTAVVDDVAADPYDVVFLPGGHGTMWDLPTSEGLGDLVSATLAREAVVGAVCHGPAGLVNARDADGRPVVAGRRVAAFTDSEEQAAGLSEVVPFLLETRLRELGAEFENGPDFEPFAVADGTLVTGQNPASSSKVAELVLTTARAR